MSLPVILSFLVGLLAIVAQTGAMFYWGGKMSAMMAQHDKEIVDHEKRLRHLEGLDTAPESW